MRFRHLAGSEFLSIIVQAIEEGICVEFDYKKYGDVSEKKRIVAPYLLKEYKNRWYILGVASNSGKVQTFALDRISAMILNAQDPKRLVTFDPAHYFKYAFGITTPDKKVERIILEFSASQAPYIKSLPIHPTQKIMQETSKFLQIQIEVIPSYELFEFILGKTPEVRVISPSGIAKTIKNALEKGIKAYRRN
jgi:predicted DNA-binding transcriptional regulator YafY